VSQELISSAVTTPMSALESELWGVIQTLNRAWTKEGKAEELKNFFHPNMIAITPTDRLCLVGGEVCVDSWKTFTDNSKIHKFEESEPIIRIYGGGNFAIVSYYFDMEFNMNGQEIQMGGRDMFVLAKENGKWWVVADNFSAYPVL
jgi:hypothetical protein